MKATNSYTTCLCFGTLDGILPHPFLVKKHRYEQVCCVSGAVSSSFFGNNSHVGTFRIPRSKVEITSQKLFAS